MVPEKLFKKILIANRSEIAVRVINACNTLGIKTVTVYSEADKTSVHRMLADESILIGPASPRESYLVIDKIIEAAKQTGADAIHPGYGFLAENHLLPERCAKEGITFIGPNAEAMRLLGNKVESRVAMSKIGVPIIPGMESSSEKISEFESMAEEIGYPVLIKAAAGGGGKGMRIVESADDITEAVDAAKREAGSAFGDDTVYLEKYLINPRHIEFQVIADSHGNCVHLFERECSIQRRHQKIIEESPSTAVTDELRESMGVTAVRVAKAAGYTNAGTVEFLLAESGEYYFLEMNTRIQVEHPVTELVTSVDLVVEQIRIAAGQSLGENLHSASQQGHAIECRLYAEDGENNFMPSTGRILYYEEPSGPGIRVDSGICAGSEVTIDYDPIMAKLIVHAPDRRSAITRMIDAMSKFRILGVKTSRAFMIDVLKHPEFIGGRTHTGFITQYMSNRVEADAAKIELAAVAASVLAASVLAASGFGSGAKSKGVSSDNPSQDSPWQLLGNWQIGDSVSE